MMQHAKQLLALAGALLLSACASLQPIDLPDETALPPFEDVFWSNLKPDLRATGTWLNDGPKRWTGA